MKVLVTGGAGFIGSHINRVLLREGHQVTVLDNLSTGHKESLPEGARFIEGDVNDTGSLNKALEGQEAVIHMAAFIIVPESIEKPMAYIENNIMGTAHLLEAMRQQDVKKVVFSSSATVYGAPKRLPIVETEPLGVPENTYGATKACMEILAQAYATMYSFDSIILRYFNPYGPGERHQPETHAVPNFIQAVLKKEPIPMYWGGEQVRDFIYVEDLARAHALVLDQKGLQIFNIGTQSGTKVKEVVEIILKIAGYRVPINDLGERPGDVVANYASSQKLKQATGWEAKVSLEEGLAATLKYFVDLGEKPH